MITICLFLIRYIFVLSVIHPLHVRELTVLCPLLVWYVWALYDFRCPSLSCPLDRLPPGGQANRGCLAPRGATCPGISCPPPWLSSPPGGKLSRPVYLAPRPTQVKIYTCYFVIFLYHFNELRSSISHKVRNWCLWG